MHFAVLSIDEKIQKSLTGKETSLLETLIWCLQILFFLSLGTLISFAF